MKIKDIFKSKKRINSDEERYRNLVKFFFKHLNRAPIPKLEFENTDTLKFKHSGNCGDIIYALPCILAICKEQKADLMLQINKPADYASYIEHPMGNVTMTGKAASLLLPLLQYQSYLKEIKIVSHGEPVQIDVDLDLIREYPLLLDRGNIARWYFQIFGVNFDLNKKWIDAPADEEAKEAIVIARSQRYHSPGIDYTFLSKYPDVQFIGLEDEYKAMQKMIPNLKYRPVRDFLEMATIIAGARLFIGNQSFPFSLAEGLKANRILEVHFECPNVTVYGDKGYDFCFQPQFEKIVKDRYEYI